MHNRYDNFPLEECGWQGCLKGVSIAVGAIIALAVCALSSCTNTRYVPVIQTRTDTVQITKQQRDSIYLKDSTHVSEQTRGDTVYIKVTRWRTESRDREVHDTIYQSRTDTVPLPYPVEFVKEEPRELTWWQKTRMRCGEASLISLFIYIIYSIYKIKRRIFV